MFPLLFALSLGCGGGPTPAPGIVAGQQRDVDVQTLAADLEAGRVGMLVDVRSDGEFSSGHVPGAVNIPLDQLTARTDAFEEHQETEIYLVCRSGGRSARAASQLAAQGYDTVNVEGGTLAWTASGRAVE